MYPSVYTTLTYPNANNYLNAPSHSSVHGQVASTLGQHEAVIGLSGASSVLGTIIGDLRSPASNGGGHVQSANTGGTGQTTFSPGDMLVAQSASSIGRLQVGSVFGQVLTATPGINSGVSWGGVPNTVIALNSSSVVLTGYQASVATVLFASSIAGGTLSTGGTAIRYKGYISNYTYINALPNITVTVNYGNNVVSQAVVSVMSVGALNSQPNMSGFIEGTIFGNVSSVQTGVLDVALNQNGFYPFNSSSYVGGYAFSTGTSSINATTIQNIVITGQLTGLNYNQASLATLGFVLEQL